MQENLHSCLDVPQSRLTNSSLINVATTSISTSIHYTIYVTWSTITETTTCTLFSGRRNMPSIFFQRVQFLFLILHSLVCHNVGFFPKWVKHLLKIFIFKLSDNMHVLEMNILVVREMLDRAWVMDPVVKEILEAILYHSQCMDC